MSKILRAIIVTGTLWTWVCAPLPAAAQSYKGDLTTSPKKQEDRAARPLPKTFSSQVSSVKQAEKLDELYNNLFVSLWIYAKTDFVHQKKLLTHMKAEKFKLTRYPQEFSGDLKEAMADLNKNYNDMMTEIEDARHQYQEIKEGIRKEDYAVLEPLWKEKIETFRIRAKKHFKMQNQFLNTYKDLVDFILQQGGSYYYKSGERQVYFYKFGGYKYFGQAIDKLNKINYEQKKHLKENVPAGISPELE